MVIPDVMLRNKSVYDILSELRSDPAIGLTLVMVLTDRDREIVLRIGATRCMTEPSADADLIAAVRDLAHLGGGRMIGPSGRRRAEAAAMLPVAGLVPFSIPVLGAEGPGGQVPTAGTGMYLVGMWGRLIADAAVLSRRLAGRAPDPASP